MRTHCNKGHEYTPDNTRYDADGAKRCITCRRAESAGYRAKRNAEAIAAGKLPRNPHPRYLPVAPILPFVDPEKLPMSEVRALERAKRAGRVSEAVADRLACAFGLHPCLVWGELWWELEEAS